MATVTLLQGDCLEVLPTLAANSVDSIVCDPPYGLSFMGKDWDHGIPGAPFWEAALRVAKPGAMLLAFGGTRTFHRLTVAIEDAGWEIRDCLTWLYGSGFPKSHDISKAIDRTLGAEQQIVGYQKASIGILDHGRQPKYKREGIALNPITVASSEEARQWDGWGTALKPAWEPVILAMKPLDGTFANNALTHGCGGLNIDASRISLEDGADLARNNKPGDNGWKNSSGGPNNAALHGSLGRWPANLLLDEEAAEGQEWARFFYCSKASRRDRNEGLEDAMNSHPTVKPTQLMRYLCRLVTPPNGLILDPFMGSGSTGKAAVLEGFRFTGIELNPEYLEIAQRRIADAQAQMQMPLLESA